ncbi:MAG: alpha/beta hydrolase, partial [Selenomonadaceae bacterium]|nr:alpha/beta hydrolase [Selenomonadaceae bacterium]
TYEKFLIDGVKVERLANPKQKKSARVVLQLHGGGYIWGLADSYRDIAVKQAVLCDAREVFLVDYRLAPENLYPAALDDAAKVYAELLNRGIDSKNIIVFGDSAGGNLALELSLYLKEKNLPQPAMLILISPWTTLETGLPSRTENADRDLILGRINPEMNSGVANPVYGGDLPLNDPRLSPIYADLKNLPPMLIQIGGYELFVDEGIELLKRATADGLDVTLSVYAGMSHDFSILLPELDDSIKSFAEIKNFVNLHMSQS